MKKLLFLFCFLPLFAGASPVIDVGIDLPDTEVVSPIEVDQDQNVLVTELEFIAEPEADSPSYFVPLKIDLPEAPDVGDEVPIRNRFASRYFNQYCESFYLSNHNNKHFIEAISITFKEGYKSPFRWLSPDTGVRLLC